MEPLLQVTNLFKHFPIEGSRSLVQAVNGVSFNINKGETLSLVGESGSGKTTVGRCVLGLIPPTGGEILYKGRPTGPSWNVRSPSLRGKIQLVFQEPGESLNPRLPIGASVEEPLRTTPLAAEQRRQRVREMIDRVRLPESVLEQYPLELSAGQQQRIAIARAVITEPELLVLDEPTSALSPTTRAEIIDLLMRIQRELGTAYLLISHDLSAVHHLSHRIAVMYLGRVVEEGVADEVFRKPHHPYSLGLLSSVMLPSPNLKRETTFALEGEIPSPIDLPPGCPLASRCPFRIDRCTAAFPEASEVTPTHSVHCYRHDEIAEREKTTDTFAAFQGIAERVLAYPSHAGTAAAPAAGEQT
jgi:oligopeptide/dipeptide ABC transporter ATP-binding protein